MKYKEFLTQSNKFISLEKEIMKKFIPILCFFVCIQIAFIDNALGQESLCAGKKFAYEFTKYDAAKNVCTKTFKCSSDPSAESGIGGPVKWPAGSSVNYCYNDLSYNSCVDGDALGDCINNAFAEWAALCPSGTLTSQKIVTGGCCVKISY